MQLMITLSLFLKVAVLLPVCWALITNSDWSVAAYGEALPARNILLSVYIAIGIIPALLLVVQDIKFIAAVLLVQVIYKVATPFTVGMLGHPVVVSNVLIAILHAITLFVIWRSVQTM